MKQLTWKKFLGDGMRFFYETSIGETKYWVTFKRNAWQLEDNCGGVSGPFKTASQAKKSVENL